MEFKAPARVDVGLREMYTMVFLAGTIDNGNSDNWQARVADFLSEKGFVVANPRRDDWDSSWKQQYEDPQFFQQVTWEMSNLEKSDIIILNLLPESSSPISLLELGLYASSGKLLVACPKEFWRRGNVEMVCDKYSIPLYETIEELLIDSIGHGYEP